MIIINKGKFTFLMNVLKFNMEFKIGKMINSYDSKFYRLSINNLKE